MMQTIVIRKIAGHEVDAAMALALDKENRQRYNNEKFTKGAATMAGNTTVLHMSMLQQHVEITVDSPGLYCRTHFHG